MKYLVKLYSFLMLWHVVNTPLLFAADNSSSSFVAPPAIQNLATQFGIDLSDLSQLPNELQQSLGTSPDDDDPMAGIINGVGSFFNNIGNNTSPDGNAGLEGLAQGLASAFENQNSDGQAPNPEGVLNAFGQLASAFLGGDTTAQSGEQADGEQTNMMQAMQEGFNAMQEGLTDLHDALHDLVHEAQGGFGLKELVLEGDDNETAALKIQIKDFILPRMHRTPNPHALIVSEKKVGDDVLKFEFPIYWKDIGYIGLSVARMYASTQFFHAIGEARAQVVTDLLIRDADAIMKCIEEAAQKIQELDAEYQEASRLKRLFTSYDFRKLIILNNALTYPLVEHFKYKTYKPFLKQLVKPLIKLFVIDKSATWLQDTVCACSLFSLGCAMTRQIVNEQDEVDKDGMIRKTRTVSLPLMRLYRGIKGNELLRDFSQSYNRFTSNPKIEFIIEAILFFLAISATDNVYFMDWHTFVTKNYEKVYHTVKACKENPDNEEFREKLYALVKEGFKQPRWNFNTFTSVRNVQGSFFRFIWWLWSNRNTVRMIKRFLAG